MAFNIRDFISATQEGLAREAHFEMLFNLPSLVKGDARQMSIMCNSATLPERNAEITTIRRAGHGLLNPYVVSTMYTPLNVTFYCDVNGNTIKSLQSWLDIMMDTTNMGNLNMIQYKNNYVVDLTLNQYDSQGKGICSYNFRGAFLSSLGPVNFAWAGRDSLVLVPATFTYSTYQVGDAPPKSKPNISTSQQPAQNNRLPVTGSTPVAPPPPFVPGGGGFGGGGASGTF